MWKRTHCIAVQRRCVLHSVEKVRLTVQILDIILPKEQLLIQQVVPAGTVLNSGRKSSCLQDWKLFHNKNLSSSLNSSLTRTRSLCYTRTQAGTCILALTSTGYWCFHRNLKEAGLGSYLNGAGERWGHPCSWAAEGWGYPHSQVV